MDYNDALPILKQQYVPRNHGVLSLKVFGNEHFRVTACAWPGFIPVAMPPCEYVGVGLCYYEGTPQGSKIGGWHVIGYVPQTKVRDILSDLLMLVEQPVPHLVYSGGMSQQQVESLIDAAISGGIPAPDSL